MSPKLETPKASKMYTPGIQDARFVNDEDETATIAPPPMLQCWAGAGLAKASSEHPTLHEQLRYLFLRAGFPAVVATDYDQVYLAELRRGDLVHEAYRIETISDLKKTALGHGYFVTSAFRYSNQCGTDLGSLRVTTLYFRPEHVETGKARAAKRTSSRAAEDELPVEPLEIPITRRLIVAGAIASNDFE